MLCLIWVVYDFANDYTDAKKSPFIGNSQGNIIELKNREGKMPFSFGFISDTENNPDSVQLIKELVNSDIDFLVFVGDFANNATVEEHKLFIKTISSMNPKFPIFLVPGNHDINLLENRSKRSSVGRDEFDILYGQRNFSFVYNNCLFIFISNLEEDIMESCNFLDNVLENKSQEIENTFLFCHTPLAKLRNKAFIAPDVMTLIDTFLEERKIDYIISGDYHRHFELVDDKCTKYIISGSGGAHFHGDSQFGRFKSGTKVTVYNNSVSEEMVIYKFTICSIPDIVKQFIFKMLMPKIEDKMYIINYIILFIILNLLFSVYLVIKSIII